MNIKCKQCHHINEVCWKIEGFHLMDANIRFKCHRCKCNITLVIEMKDASQDVKVDYDLTNYIG